MRKLALGVSLLLLAASNAFASPSEVATQHPLGMMHLSTTPRGTAVLEEGEVEVRLSGAISNTLNIETDIFRIDAETREGTLLLSYGLTPDLTASLRQSIDYRGAGWTDQGIDEWHKFYGLPRGPRRRTSKDKFIMEALTTDGSTFSLTRDGVAFSDLDIELKYLAWRSPDGDTRVSVVPALRLPTGADTYGQDSVDAGLNLIASRTFGRFEVTGGLSYVYFLDQTLGELRFTENHYGAFFACEYHVTKNFALLVELIGESALLDNAVQYPDYQTYIDFGVSYRLSDGVLLEALLREDPAPEDSTADITVFGGVRWQFGNENN